MSYRVVKLKKGWFLRVVIFNNGRRILDATDTFRSWYYNYKEILRVLKITDKRVIRQLELITWE